MKTRTIHTIALYSMAALCLPFVSCSDDDDNPVDTTETPAAALNHINLFSPDSPAGSLAYQPGGYFLTDASKELTLFPVQSVTPATEDITLTVKIKPIAIDFYNLYHDTYFKALRSARIVNPRLTIKKGETLSSEAIQIQFDDLSEFQDGQENHMLALAVDTLPEGIAEGEYGELLLNFRKVYRPNHIQARPEISPVGLSYGDGTLNNLKDELTVGSAFQLESPAQDAMKVTLAIDESKVATYNESHGTSYVMFPNVQLKETAVELTAGERSISCQLQFTDGMASVKEGVEYLVPVVLKSAEGAGATLGKEVVAYIPFTTESVFSIEMQDEPVGNKITDMNDWEVTVDGQKEVYGMSWSYILQGFALDKIGPNKPIIVDMKKTFPVKSIQWKTEMEWYTLTKVKVGVSTDGVNYQEEYLQIESSPEDPVMINNFVFPKAVDARYIRFISDEISNPLRISVYQE